jgi:3-hydroxy-5-methyl-1-naphthoate 3-O-methyltransferase
VERFSSRNLQDQSPCLVLVNSSQEPTQRGLPPRMASTTIMKIWSLVTSVGCVAFAPHHFWSKSTPMLVARSVFSNGAIDPEGITTNLPKNATLEKSSTKFSTKGLGRRDAISASAAVLSSPIVVDHFFPILHPAALSANELETLEIGDSLVRSIWLGRLTYPVLILALETGLFEALKEHGLTKSELGKRMNPTLPGNGQAIEAMTSVLVPLGLLELDHDRIELTEPARSVLLKDSPYFWGPQLLAADGLTTSLRRALKHESLGAKAIAETSFQAHSNGVISSFTASMQAHSSVTAELTAVALKDVLVGSNPAPIHILDMAGGSGCFARTLVEHYPQVRVTLADLPPVVNLWRRSNKSNNNRIEAKPADLFDVSTWPNGPDVVLLANVLHDWGQEQVSIIVRNARSVLKVPSGRLVIIEQLLADEKDGPLPSGLASVSMLLGDWRTGKQYSFRELRDLLLEAGFNLVELGPQCGKFHRAIVAYV